MDDVKEAEHIHTRIWQEDAEQSNPFAARAAFCHGYDVYGEMLGSARWSQMIYLLFRGDPPSPSNGALLDALAVALANPGPRDPSVHAAMCAGVCGSTAASSLMAALAVGAGSLSGSREVMLAMQGWSACSTDLNAWEHQFTAEKKGAVSIWPDMEHVPGFDPHGKSTSLIVRQTLSILTNISTDGCLSWLSSNLQNLESKAGRPLAMSGVAAAAFHDMGFSPEQGEMLYLLLRLPGAAVHALEQREYGFRKFPFYAVELNDDPAKERSI